MTAVDQSNETSFKDLDLLGKSSADTKPDYEDSVGT